jgi:hypothetical protein
MVSWSISFVGRVGCGCRFDGLFYAICDLIVQLNGKIGRRERAWPAPRLEEGCPTSTDDVDRAQFQLAPVERLANVALSKVGFDARDSGADRARPQR